MIAQHIIAVGSLLLCLTYAEVERPRGVSISMASLYKPGETFKCLDGSQEIPYNHVNDDYCDCKDGSDEPGTSACPNGMFHCTNAGHKPEYIPSSRVGDGICDCCDGTDEKYDAVTECQNTCRELGRAAREEAERKKQLLEAGYKIRQEYIEQGKKAIEEKKGRLQELEREKVEAETKRTELEKLKNEAEAPEKEAKEKHEKEWEEIKVKKQAEKDEKKCLEAFAELDTDLDQSLSVSELKVHLEFDKDGDNIVSDEEAKEYLEDNNQVDLATFKEKVWPNIKEIYKPPGKDGVTEPPPPETAEMGPPTDMDEGPVGEGGEEEEEEEDDDEEETGDTGEPATPPPEEEEEKMPEYPEETKKLMEVADAARTSFNEADVKFRDVEKEMNEINEFLNSDLGPDNSFYPLKGQCYEYTDREYTFKLCPFDRVTQRPKNGGTEFNLGTWGKWEGPENNLHSKMHYQKGQNCWNGPDRNTVVTLSCGTENQVLSVSEPNRCEYAMDFTTPAVCVKQALDKPSDPGHDEL